MLSAKETDPCVVWTYKGRESCLWVCILRTHLNPHKKASYTETFAQTHSLCCFGVFATAMVWVLQEGTHTTGEMRPLVASKCCAKPSTVSKMGCGWNIAFQDTGSVCFMRIGFSFMVRKGGNELREIPRCSTYCLIMSSYRVSVQLDCFPSLDTYCCLALWIAKLRWVVFLVSCRYFVPSLNTDNAF